MPHPADLFVPVARRRRVRQAREDFQRCFLPMLGPSEGEEPSEPDPEENERSPRARENVRSARAGGEEGKKGGLDAVEGSPGPSVVCGSPSERLWRAYVVLCREARRVRGVRGVERPDAVERAKVGFIRVCLALNAKHARGGVVSTAKVRFMRVTPRCVYVWGGVVMTMMI